jgi:mono/diheme cytochrome c family protein
VVKEKPRASQSPSGIGVGLHAGRNVHRPDLVLPIGLAVVLLVGCRGQPRFTQPLTLAEGKTVASETLNDGYEGYMLYCYACHGEKGDGRGPAAPGMRPPPRDFTQAMFKFGGVPAGSLPNDEDMVAVLRTGLAGTPMLAWDIQDQERRAIVQYLKIFSPKWKDEPPGARVEPEGPDPWRDPGKQDEALDLGKRLYHLNGSQTDRKTGALVRIYPGCNVCHPSYLPRAELEALARRTLKQPVEFRPDLYQPAADKKSDYFADGHQTVLVPIDFLFQPIKAGSSTDALYRTITAGINGASMPSFKGVMSDGDLWALTHYIKSLADLRGTPAATDLHARLSSAR